ncbi:MAG: flagellar brake domain-containing protein [Roseburia sp.]|nr:flagellar brake domain-containing protein [Roseburia sp.]
MAVSDVIRLGDKIDIRLVQQLENKNGDEPSIYRSQVLDIKENGNFEIAMPTEKGKLILLPLGVRFEFIFYSYSGGLYKSIGQVVERYKKDGFFMLEIQLRTALEKFQRREYYRYNCTQNFKFYVLDEEQKQMESVDELYRILTEGDFNEDARQGLTVDLSGGGMKFRSENELNPGDKVMVLLRLTNDKMDRQFNIVGNVIACVEVRLPAKVVYESRVRFHIEDNRIREEIIRYIFEEERKVRQKENG